jgi:cell volume regulation protein A
MTWLAQIVMFLMLGLLATPSEFLDILAPVLAVAFFLMFIARPAAVILCLLPFGFRRSEIAFISWVGLRGAVSILLAILPILGGLEFGQLLFNAAFIIVLVSLLVQGWTIRATASWLGLVVPPSIGPIERELLELPGSAHHELVVYHIAPRSPVARGERLPRWARPSLVIRDGRSMRIHQAGRLQPGDYVYIFTAPAHIQLLDRLFASPHALDDRDFAFFGDMTIQPSARIADLVRAYDIDWNGDTSMTVGGYLHEQLGTRAEVGDRLALDTVDLIVREVDAHGRIMQIGLALLPRREEEELKKDTVINTLRDLFIDKPRRAATRIRGDKSPKK